MEAQLQKLLNQTAELLERVRLLIEKVDNLTEHLNAIIYEESDTSPFADR